MARTSPTVFASVRLSPTASQLWEDTAKHLGINKTACLEIAIRKLARAEGVPEKPVEETGKEEESDG